MKALFQKWLFLFVLAAFVITFGASWWLHSYLAENSALDLLQSNLEDVYRRVKATEANLKIVEEMSNAAALAKTHAFARIIAENPAVIKDREKMESIRKKLDVDELHVSDGKGILISSVSFNKALSYNGYDMKSQPQSAAFMPAITDKNFELVQTPQLSGSWKILFQYAGVARIDQPGIVQIGYRPERIEKARHLADIDSISAAHKIGLNGTLDIRRYHKIPKDYKRVVKNAEGISLSIGCDDYLLTATLPREEMYMSRDSVIKVLVVGNLILFGVIFLLVSRLLQKVVINGIYTVNSSLNEITQGNLDKKVQVGTTSEFKSLSKGINATVNALKKAIENEAQRIDAELEMGRTIQTSVLPVEFPDNEKCHLAAGMFTAREVGGDFYDFFTVDENRIAIIVADVSGKGITAALYMMTAKTLLKELLQKHPPAEAFDQANQELCRNNKAHMFLTAFVSVIDLRDGTASCVNAGHNPPLLLRHNGEAAYLKIKHSLVLSASKRAKYTAVPVKLEHGDKICLYTDGVTEAMNCRKELFGEERLLKTLQNAPETPEAIVETIRKDVAAFAGEEPQNDDITVLVFEYK